MKSLTLGCIGVLLGVGLGIVLTLGAWTVLANAESSASVAPVVNTARSDVTITVSAKYLNTQLQQAVKQTAWAKQATLTLVAPDIVQINATIETRILGQTMTISTNVRVRVSVQNGRVALTVEKIDGRGIGVLPILVAPVIEQVRAQAEDQINKTLQRELQRTGLRLTNIRLSPNEMVIDLTAQ